MQITEQPVKQEYEIEELKMITEELKKLKEAQEPDSVREYFCGRVNEYCQMIIWGDKQNPDFFEFFCESKGLELLFSILTVGKMKDLMVSVISGVSKLISNLSRENLQVMLNSHALFCFQMIKFSMVSTEVAQYYVNFLKILSQKVDDTTIHLVFNHKYPSFALAWQSIRFFNHPQTLIRTTCRNILLSLSRINEPHVIAFMSSFPLVIFYSHLSAFIREHWVLIDNYMEKKEILDGEAKKAKLLQAIEDHYDLVLYLEDMIKLNQHGIVHGVMNGFLSEGVSVLYQSLISNNKEVFGIKFIVYVLGVLFKVVTQAAIADSLALVFFGRYQLKGISERLVEPKTPLSSYNQTWSFKHFWDNFDEVLQKYNKDNYQRVGKSNPENTNLMVPFWEETLAFFTTTRPKFETEHLKIVATYGLGTATAGLSQFLAHLSQNLKVVGGILDLTQFDDNPAKQILLSFVQSKDDTLVMLTFELILNLMKCRGASKHVLQFCGLNPSEKSTEFYTRTNFEKLVRQALQVLKLEPVTYRLCTIKNATELIEIICKPYINKIEEILTPQLKVELILALKMAVERIKVHFETHKGLVSLVQLFQKCSQDIKKVRVKTLASFGIVQQGTQAQLDIFEKSAPLSIKQQIQKDFYIFFILKSLLQSIGLKAKDSLKLNHAPQKDLEQLSRYPKYKQIDLRKDSIECSFKLPEYQKPHRCGIVILKGGFLLAECSNGKSSTGIIKIASTYHNISKMQIQSADHNLLRVKMVKGCDIPDFDLIFEGYKGSTSTKIRIEDCRFQMAKYVFEQINTSLSRTIQEAARNR